MDKNLAAFAYGVEQLDHAAGAVERQVAHVGRCFRRQAEADHFILVPQRAIHQYKDAVLQSAMRAGGIQTVIVHGTHDWICVPRNARILQRCMPHAQVRWIARGTHAASHPLIRNALRNAIDGIVPAQLGS